MTKLASGIAMMALLLLGTSSSMAQTVATSDPVVPAASSEAEESAPRQLNVVGKQWHGDFNDMLERRLIRIAVPYSRSLYFIDKGRERGIDAELARDFERWVNTQYAKQLGRRPLTVYLVATTRDRLLPDLPEGMADIAIGNLSVTDERKQIVDFVAPDAKSINTEILVTGPAGPEVGELHDLSGKTVHVRAASSYHNSLMVLNERFEYLGMAPVNLVLVPDALEDEDMLEMVNAGLIGAMVVDDWKAIMWSSVLKNLVVHDEVVLRPATRKGWAVRKDSPQLVDVLNAFYNEWAKSAGVIPYRQKKYMQSVKSLNNSVASADQKRFEQTLVLFRKYGTQYNFDPIMLAAQGYQESTLDQTKKSRVGAVGVMQIMPATGADLKVGDINDIESNVHGGAKYMDQLMTRYFKDANFSATNRTLFAFASYNAGPGNISKMRKEAAKRGLDPDKWFNNVEVITAEKIGMETTTYVRNIYKYYVSYKLALDAAKQVEALKQQMAPAKQ